MAMRIEVIGGPLAGSRFRLDQLESFVFGRSDKADGRIPDDVMASRLHFIIEIRPPLARIQDLGSVNGTHVNEVAYGGRAPDAVMGTDLCHGDIIRAGRSVMIFKTDAEDDPDRDGAAAGAEDETPRGGAEGGPPRPSRKTESFK